MSRLLMSAAIAAVSLGCVAVKPEARVAERMRWMEVGRGQWSGEQPLESATGVWEMRLDEQTSSERWVVVQKGNEVFVEILDGAPLSRRGFSSGSRDPSQPDSGKWVAGGQTLQFDPTYESLTVEWFETTGNTNTSTYQPNLNIGTNVAIGFLSQLGQETSIRHLGHGARAWKRPSSAAPPPGAAPPPAAEPAIDAVAAAAPSVEPLPVRP